MSGLDLTKIGGSDIASILGKHPYQSAMDLYTRLTTVGHTDEDSEQMARGRDFEDAIAKAFRREMANNHYLKLPAERNQAKIVTEFWRASADDWFPSFGFGAEYKTAGDVTWKQFGSGPEDMPPHYWVQCAWYNRAFGAKHWYCYVMKSVSDFKLYTIERDHTVENALYDAAKRFWDEHVVPRIPPSGYVEVTPLPDYSKAVKELSPEEAQDFEEYNQARSEEAHWALHSKAKADTIREKYAEFGGVRYQGAKLSWTKVVSESTSWKNVALELNPSPEIIAKHTKPPKESIRYTFKKAVENE